MFDRYDVCDAYYLYAALYHGGQWTLDYEIFGRLHAIGYKPNRTLSVETLGSNARLIFDELVAKKGYDPYTSE